MEVDYDEEREDERGRCPCRLGHEGVVKDRDDDQEKGNIEDKINFGKDKDLTVRCVSCVSDLNKNH